jgi:acyl-CoA synthetase (AMP-forming)/AMP-acid ligase II
MPPDSESTAPAPETLERLLAGTAGARSAIVCPDDGSTRSYDDLGSAAARLAGLLSAAGVERGDRVALVLGNGPEIVEAVLGIAMLGAMAAPLNPAYTVDEYAFYLEDLDPRLLLLGAGEHPNARRGAPEGVRVAELDADAGGRMRVRAASHELSPRDFEPSQPDDVALLLHTSGTTSRPKQVPLRQRNLAYSARSIAACYGLGGGDVSFCAMPLFHVHGLVASTLAALAAGGTVVIPRRYTSRGLWAQAREHGATWLSAGPTTHQMALDAREGARAPETLRFVRSCSSALPPELMERAEREYGVPVLEAYGMTEASHQMTSNPLPPARRIAGSVGVAAGAEIRILDEQGNALAEGESGEVAVRGPGIISGYLNNPEANAEAFAGEWFRTGDLGVLDDGYLHLRGRLKEMILRGGENISPYEVEAALLGHPAVADAVCFAVADGKYGEVVGAAVALEADVEVDALADHCRERLASFKVPTVIHVLDAIPRTATGKVQRRHVAASLADER